MESQDSQESDDQRDIELCSLSAIFPEIQVHESDSHTIILEVPVEPSKAVVVLFPEAVNVAPSGPAVPKNGDTKVDSHEVAYLPSTRLQLSLPDGYPTEHPPKVLITTSPPWLPGEIVQRLEDDVVRLWEEFGHDLVAFTYIDHVRQCAEDVFGMADARGVLELDSQHKIALLDYDIKARRAAFEKGTFDCGICLGPKKGSACHRMLDCGHVFCVECLRDFYNNAIKEGDLASVRCLAPNCAKERDRAESSMGKKRRKQKTFISPGELLQIPLDHDMVQRYVDLKYKTELEADKNTIYCPRPWCGGAARSKKHRKPEGLELVDTPEESDSDEEIATAAVGTEKKAKAYRGRTAELLAICEDCGFAFCSRCLQSWHGEFYFCMPPRERGDLTAEEKASLEYMALHTTPCPTCAAPVQKTHGCNHMTCFRCQTHFCYLCSAWLDPGNPYQHFNELPGRKRTGCYNRLWELEAGDGADVGRAFEGGREGAQAPPVGQPVVIRNAVPELEGPNGEAEGVEAERPEARQEEGRRQADEDGGRVEVAREGPLVLRIEANRPAAPRGRGGGRGDHAPRAGDRGQRNGLPAADVGRQQQPQRGRGGGRGGRGGGAGPGGGGPGRGAAAAARRQNQLPHQARGAGHNNDNDDDDAAARDDLPDVEDEVFQANNLNEAQQAWVRQFVRLALNDEEDLVDSDDEDDGFE